MILLHRISSFVIVAFLLCGFWSLHAGWMHPYTSIIFTVVAIGLVLARLLDWSVRSFQFWHLLGTPVLFILTSFGPFMLLEDNWLKMGLVLLVIAAVFLFVEHIFSFLHLPTRYQPFTLEYLSQLLHTLSVFFFSVLAFGLILFLQIPLWFLSILFFLCLFFIVYGTLWVGKIEAIRARPYAFVGALLTTEIFAALSFLPTGFYSNAAFIALCVYVFLGLSRAHALHKLSKDVLKRYVGVFILLVLIIILTSQWV